MRLFYRTFGHGKPLIILHGLFGASGNWNTLAKVLSAQFNVFAIDQRNHGQSPHSDTHNYKLLTEDLHTFINEQEIKKPIILGHSMGGKTAMNFAVKYPDKLSHLIIVDIAPRPYPIHHETILKGLLAIPLAQLQSRKQADQILSQHIPEPFIRQFLLKNLARNQHQKFIWKANLSALNEHIDEIGSGIQYPGQFDGPSLFIKGNRSGYITPDDENNIKSIFPKTHFVALNTGHWVHAEEPHAFVQAVVHFLSS